jgi:hypothetical protein
LQALFEHVEQTPVRDRSAAPDAPPARYVETEDAAMDWDYVLWRGAS